MSDTSRWTSMSERTSGRMFGIYRDSDPRRNQRTATMNFKLLTFLGVLASSALVVCFVSLMLTRTSLPELTAKHPLNISDDNKYNTKTPHLENATEPKDGVQETLSRPTGSRNPAVNYPQSEEKSEVEEAAATTHSHRRPEPRSVRNFAEDSVEAKIVNVQRPPPDREGTVYSQLPSYGEEYAQLEGYRSPPRGVQEVMSWLERPGVKFNGVYFKSEEKPYLNGHAYVSDPFVRFKPSHPSEINQLAVDADRGTRFSNRPDPQPSGSHTQAIFHSKIRPRPLKIMLDIYPMIPESLPGMVPPELSEQRGNRQRVPLGPSHNRMIVHLNLYPKKSSKMTHRRIPLPQAAVAEERVFDESAEKDEAPTLTTTEDFTIAYESTTQQIERQ